ncbi:hypothetical protein PG999_003308 [Apiospora kogelbergensis]|uniref:SAP domain-containing protein n=1 Tax=Apiospora kogelbergensis TaxID=1337665 RepID=A0AAW0R348_9PEZI
MSHSKHHVEHPDNPEDIDRQLGYLLAKQLRNGKSGHTSEGNGTPRKDLCTWLSYYLNDERTLLPEDHIDLPRAPGPRFTAIDPGASLDEIEKTLLSDAGDLKAYRFFVLKPFRDKLIESWDMYYPWFQIWQDRVADAAADAKAHGLLDNTSELMERLKRRGHFVSDIGNCTFLYETGHGSEYFNFVNIGQHPKDYVDDEASGKVASCSSPEVLRGTHDDPLVDASGGHSPKVCNITEPAMSNEDVMHIIDYMAQQGAVELNIYACINKLLRRPATCEAMEQLRPTRREHRRLLTEYAPMVDVDFDPALACSRPITLHQALQWKKWICRTRAGTFCIECPCPKTACLVLLPDGSEAAHELIPRYFHMDPFRQDFAMQHFRDSHGEPIMTTSEILTMHGRKVIDGHSTEFSIATHNFIAKLWGLEAASEWARLPRQGANSESETIDSSCVTKVIRASPVSDTDHYRFALPGGDDAQFILICTFAGCDWLCENCPFTHNRAKKHFQVHGLDIANRQVLEHFVFQVVDHTRMRCESAPQKRTAAMLTQSPTTHKRAKMTPGEETSESPYDPELPSEMERCLGCQARRLECDLEGSSCSYCRDLKLDCSREHNACMNPLLIDPAVRAELPLPRTQTYWRWQKSKLLVACQLRGLDTKGTRPELVKELDMAGEREKQALKAAGRE